MRLQKALARAIHIIQTIGVETIRGNEMADYDIKLNTNQLVDVLSKNDAIKELLESVLNQVLSTQMTEHLGAERHEQTEERVGYRNGTRVRELYTRVGPLSLQVPQTRDGSFKTEIFKRYQRSEQAFVLGIMEMYLEGVSCRKVTKITEQLCGCKFSKSTVSELCVELDARMNAWRNRRLHDKKYPFLIIDALVVKVRRDGAVRPTGVLIIYGINEDGVREPLDLLVANSESLASWTEIFKRLKHRGLNGLELLVSDDHAGLVKAVNHEFQGVIWQRCQTHFMRNILGHSPRHLKQSIANDVKLIFTAENKEVAVLLARDTIARHEGKASRAMDCLENGLEDGIAVLLLPQRYRQRLRTSNLAERMNEEIRRRERVIRIFPNDEAVIRLIGALLAEKHDEWQAASKYFDMTEFWQWMVEQETDIPIGSKVVAIN